MTTMSPHERQTLLLELLRKLMRHEIHQGQLLRTIRKQVLHLTQTEYANMVGVSRRTLSDIELGNSSQAQSIINKVFHPLGLTTGLIPTMPSLTQKLFEQDAPKSQD